MIRKPSPLDRQKESRDRALRGQKASESEGMSHRSRTISRPVPQAIQQEIHVSFKAIPKDFAPILQHPVNPFPPAFSRHGIERVEPQKLWEDPRRGILANQDVIDDGSNMLEPRSIKVLKLIKDSIKNRERFFTRQRRKPLVVQKGPTTAEERIPMSGMRSCSSSSSRQRSRSLGTKSSMS